MSEAESDEPLVDDVKMKDLNEEEAYAILLPHLTVLATCIRSAWVSWKKLRDSNADLGVLYERTRACAVNDFMWHQVTTAFSGLEGFHLSTSKGIRQLIVDGRLGIRFKKLDENRRSRNIMTTQQQALQFQMPIPGIPKLAYLTAGYILDELGTDIVDTSVAMPQGRSNAWAFDLPTVDIEFMSEPEPAREETRTRRVTAKRRSEDNEAS